MVPPETADTLAAWLRDSLLAARASVLLQAGVRLAQEAVGLEEIASMDR